MSLALLIGSGITAGAAAGDPPDSTEPVPTVTSEPTSEPGPSEPATSVPEPTGTPEPSDPPVSEPPPAPSTTTSAEPSAEPSTEPEPAPAAGAQDPAPGDRSDPEPARPGAADLRVSAQLDKATYKASDQVRVRVTIRNTSDVAAEGVRASGGGDLDVWGAWGALGTDPGVRIEPHATRVAELSGRILNASDGTVTFSARVRAQGGDANPADNGAFAEVPLTAATGVFAGTVVADTDHDGTVEPGETLAGVSISLNGPSHQTTTDAHGRFSFTDLPVGTYSVNYLAGFPWVVIGLGGSDFDVLTIDDSGRYADVTLTAIERLSSVLRVRLTFDRPSYAATDTTRLTVTLDNGSNHDLSGVTARCQGFTGSPDLRGGPGWGPLADGAAGVTVAAGGHTSIDVTEAVPADSPRYGYVSVSCAFGPASYPTSARVFGAATAAVPGRQSPVRGQVAQDLNQNFRVDPGEELPGIAVTIADQDTGAVAGRAQTGGDGRFDAGDLPVGVYDVRFGGPWRPANNLFYKLTVIADNEFGADVYFLRPATGQEGKVVNLRVSAAFDKPAYESGDTMHVTLTVSNGGDADAIHVRMQPDLARGALGVTNEGWGELYPFGVGVTIGAGQTRVFDVFGTATQPALGFVSFSGRILSDPQIPDTYFPNNLVDIEAPVTLVTASYTGVVYADRDGDGQVDPGEGLGGIQVSVSGGVPIGFYSQTTGPVGGFAFTDLPTGPYFVGWQDPTGRWVVPGESGRGFDEFVLDGSGLHDVRTRAVPPLSDTLHASIAFTKKAYAELEIAHLTVTLTNTGAVDLTGVAVSEFLGEVHGGLFGGPGWGPLQPGGPGVTVPAGATVTLDVSEEVPAGTVPYGNVYVIAVFGATGHAPAGFPYARADARVPGATGSVEGRLVQAEDPAGPPEDRVPVPDTKVVLIDPFTGAPVAKTRSDAGGRFVFDALPAGQYLLRVVGPWEFAEPFGEFLYVYEGGGNAGDILLRPGPEQPDPFPDDVPATPGPAPGAPGAAGQPPAAASLASTGASVIGLGVLSLGLVIAGLVALTSARRRRTG